MALPVDYEDFVYPFYIRGQDVNVAIDIVAQTVGNIGIDIAAQSLGTVSVDIAAMTFGTVSVDIVAQTVGNITIDIAAASMGNLPIDIMAQTLGNVAIDVAAQTVGNIGINIAAQTLGTVKIDVTSQTVDLNIKTSGGVNLMIDKLTQEAYTCRSFDATNDNGIVAGAPPTAWQWFSPIYVKKFARQCVGLIAAIQVYLRNESGAARDVRVRLTPEFGLGVIYDTTVSVPNGTAWGWFSFAFWKVWYYDSMVIHVSAPNVAGLEFGVDGVAPWDSAWTNDMINYTTISNRVFFRALFRMVSVGSVPVSGCVTNIQLPNVVSGMVSASQVWADGVTDIIPTTYGAGTLKLLQVYSVGLGNANLFLGLVIDGTAYEYCWVNLQAALAGVVNTPTRITLAVLDAPNTRYQISLNFDVHFRHSLRVYVRTAPGPSVGGAYTYAYELMR